MTHTTITLTNDFHATAHCEWGTCDGMAMETVTVAGPVPGSHETCITCSPRLAHYCPDCAVVAREEAADLDHSQCETCHG